MDNVTVVIGALALIVLIVWWFFGKRKGSSVAASQNDGKQHVVITVDGGYNPNVVTLEHGIPAELEFIRKDPSGCLEQVVFPDLGISEKLPLGESHTVRFTPTEKGEIGYACGMNMFFGKVVVK